jgi:hypothetical protein
MPVTLTDRVVQQAKATDVRVEIPDAVVPGLYLIVQPTGVKSWAVRYRVGERRRKLTLQGRYPVLSLAKARDAARTALESISEGEDPSRCQARGNACRRHLGRLHSALSGKACQHSAAGYGSQHQPRTRAHAGRTRALLT